MSWLPDWLTGFDREAYEAGKEADKKNREITDQLHDQGLMSDKDYKSAVDHYDEADRYDPDADIQAEFNKGLDEGADNIRNFLGDTINTAIGTPLSLIPWQVWVAAALYAAWWLGLFKGLLGMVKKG